MLQVSLSFSWSFSNKKVKYNILLPYLPLSLNKALSLAWKLWSLDRSSDQLIFPHLAPPLHLLMSYCSKPLGGRGKHWLRIWEKAEYRKPKTAVLLDWYMCDLDGLGDVFFLGVLLWILPVFLLRNPHYTDLSLTAYSTRECPPSNSHYDSQRLTEGVTLPGAPMG